MKNLLFIFLLLISKYGFCNYHIYTSLNEAFENKDSVEILQLSNIEEVVPESIKYLIHLKEIRLINLKASFDIRNSIKNISLNKNIQSIALYGNEHNFLPEEIILMENLKYIELNNLDFTSLQNAFDILSKLNFLEKVCLKHFTFSQLPENILNLKNLKSLDISYSEIQDVNQLFEIVSRTTIESLNISMTSILEIPGELAKLKSLKNLKIDMMKLNVLD